MQFKPPYYPDEPEWQQQPTIHMPISPSYTQPNMQQLPSLQIGYASPQRLKRNLVLWSVSGGIACIILAVIGYVLLSGHSFSPSSTTAVPQYPSLHASYKGTITDPSIASQPATTSPMVLVINSDDHQ